MKDTRRGIMLITTLLVTTLILVFFVSITSMTFQSQREIRMAAENEKAVLAARTAYQEGLFYLSRDIYNRLTSNAEKRENGEKIDKTPITASQNWMPVRKAGDEDPLRETLSEDIFPSEYMMGYAYLAKYPYTSGLVVAGGSLQTDRGRIVKYVIASQITEYEGIIAGNIRFDESFDGVDDFQPDEDDPPQNADLLKSAISSVYSVDSGFPLKPWVGVNVPKVPKGKRISTVDYIKKHIPQGYIDVDFRNPKYLVCNPFVPAEDVKEKLPPYSLYDFNTAVKFADFLGLDKTTGPKQSNERGPWKKYTSYKLLYSQQGTGKNYYEGESATDFSALVPSSSADHLKGFKSIEVLHADSMRSENIITGNNFWLIPWKNKKLAGETEKLQRYWLKYGVRELPDLVLDNSLLIVTGNLKVTGNIRGNGVLAVYGDLTFYPNSAAKSSDNLVIYASGRIKCESKSAEAAQKVRLMQSMPSYLPTRLLAYVNKTQREYDGYSAGFDDFIDAKNTIRNGWTWNNFKKVFCDYRKSYRKPGGRVWNENYWNRELYLWYELLKANHEI